MARHPARNRKFRPDIEGLRAIAVVMVLLDHAGLAILRGGYVGVDVFFVLSGFLITGLLLKEVGETGTVSLGRFYARRARRLLPAATLVLLATVFLSYQVFGDVRANRIAEDARWSALFASNFRFIEQGTDYLGAQAPPSPLQHFWSLAVEEQFYFVWPLLIMLLAAVFRGVSMRLKLGVTLTVMIAASFTYSIYLTRVDATTAYFSPFPRASELAAGALLAVAVPWLARIPRRLGAVMSWAGVATVIATGFLYEPTTVFPGAAIALPVLGAMLAVAGGTVAPEGGAEVVLKQAPFQWIGKISYSLYLWHWPVILLAAGYAGRELSVDENLALYVPAVALSALTYVLVEDPIRSAKALVKRPAFVSVGMGLALVATTFGTASAMLQVHHLAGEKIDESLTIEAPTTDGVLRAVARAQGIESWPAQPPRAENPAYSDECDVTRKDTTSALCKFGDPDSERTVVVYGDSHAAMWIPAFDRIGAERGWKVIQLTKPGCIAPDFPNYSHSLGREYTECAEFRGWALEQIERIEPDVLVVTSARKGVVRSDDGEPTTDGLQEAWEAGLDRVLERVTPHAGRVVLLGDMAYAEQGGIDCLSERPDDVQACATPTETAVLADHNAMEQRVAAEHGAEYVDAIPWFCAGGTCPAVIGDLTVRRDAMHVSENYALFLSTALGDAVGLARGPAAG